MCSSANRHRLQHEKKYIKCQSGLLWMTPICKQLGIPKFHDIPKIQDEPHVAGSNVMHQVHESHKLCLDLLIRIKNINSINYFSSQVKNYYTSCYWESAILSSVAHHHSKCHHAIYWHCTNLYWIFIIMALDWVTYNSWTFTVT